MKKEEIFTSLDKMLENPKTKNFINHLVRSYMPITNVTKVMEKPTGEFKCVLTKDTLFSAEDILTGLETEEFKNNLMTYLKNMFDEKADKTTPIARIVGEKKLGVTGVNTNTFMSYPAFEVFYDWVITKSLRGDKHINWLLGSIRRNSFIERAEKIQDSDVQTKVQNFRKQENKGRATFALGDLDVLQKLKDSFKNE